jgi:uncharacterized protein
MTAATLKNYSCKDLAQMAKVQGVVGWHAMRKEELLQALIKRSKQQRRQPNQPGFNLPPLDDADRRNGGPKFRSTELNPATDRRPGIAAAKDLSLVGTGKSAPVERDRLVVMVRDPYWLQVYWELSRSSIDRAESAMGPHWHTAAPVLRLYKMAVDGTSALVRNIPIHGGVSHWYVEVQEPPNEYRLEIGYLAAGGHFYGLARSNSVTTPRAGTSDAIDENWTDVADNADRIFAMSGGYSSRGTSLELQELLEERLGRPLGTPMETRYGDGAARVLCSAKKLQFSVDAELLVFGVSNPGSHVTLQGEPVPLRPDGTFSVRMSLADRRQVIPVIASSADGLEQRTIILAVERNTKVLEPRLRDVAH